MAIHDCLMCGYSYDPLIGDPANNIPPGTVWAEVPEDWGCPECGATKDDFTPRT